MPTDIPVVEMAIVALNDYLGAEAPEAWRRILVIVLDGLRASREAPSDLPAAIADSQLERAVTRRRARRR